MYGIRIVIADTDAAYRRSLKDAFRHADYLVVGEASDARSALQIVFQVEPQVVLLDPYIPGCESIDITGIIDEHQVAPVVAIASQAQVELKDYALLPGVYGIFVKPLCVDAVQPVIECALTGFDRDVRLRKELKELRQVLEERKIIEKAKGLLMERKKISENDAYKYLQKISMDRCVPLAKVARNVVLHYRQHGNDL